MEFPPILMRLTAWSAVVSAICIITKKLLVELLLPLNPVTMAIGSAGLLLGLFSMIGLYLYQHEESGLLGLIGFLTLWFGLAASAGADYAKNFILPYLSKSALHALLAGPTKLVFVSCLLFFLFGALLFSAAMLKARRFPLPAILLFSSGFGLWGLSFALPDTIVRPAEVVGALGVAWFGYVMVTASRQIARVRSSQPVPAR